MKTQSLRSGRFRLSSFVTVALLFIGSSQPASAQHVDPAPNAGLRALTFARHADTTFAGPTGMGLASNLLQRCDRISAPDQDVACDITFQQTGGIGTFGTTGDGLDIIITQAELNAVLNDTTAWVKVVTMIGFCAGTAGTSIGCAPIPGTTMAIVNGLGVNTTGEVVAHEFGHNQGLGHRDDRTQNLMHSSALGTDEVNQAECMAFHANLANNGPIAPTDFPPNITCPSNTTGQCSAFGGTPSGDPQLAAFFAGVSAEDGCEAAPTITDNSPSLFPVGQSPVTFTATDGGGNTDSCNANVNVVDTRDPTINCPTGIAVECAAPGGTPASDPAIAAFLNGATATDVCDSTPTITNNAPSFFNLGQRAVSFTTADDSGNSANCTSILTVQDTIPPNLTCPADPVVSATSSSGAAVSYAPTVMDSCSATVACTPPSGSTFPVGTTPVSCTATDAGGLTDSCGFAVTVQTTDLSVTKQAPARLVVQVGGQANLTYTIGVKNNGPGVAGGVALSDPLPSGTTFVSAAASQGSCSTPSVGSGGTVLCNVGSLPRDASATVTLVAKVRSGLLGLKTVTNSARVSAATFDPTSANNSATVKTTVVTVLTQ